MFISHKNNKISSIHEQEWMCRSIVKGTSDDAYRTWEKSITTIDSNGIPTIDYSGETEYTIVECTDEDVQARLNQLGEYSAEGVYNITWSDSKVSAVTGQDEAGEDITIQTHFSGNDTTKDARLLADKWTAVRRDRDNRLSQTDYLALSDSTLADNMTTYRQALRDVPSQADPDNITWPVKP